MEKVDPKIFKRESKNPVMSFIEDLEVGEVAKIMKEEWTYKSRFDAMCSAALARKGIRVSLITMEDHYLVKRVK